jgi:hypothetical protein
MGLFPEWMPGLDAGLLHQGQLVTKKQEAHVITVSTAPALQDAIIKDSKKQDTQIAEPRTNKTFNNVDWQANQSSFTDPLPRPKIQILKYAHEWTPTMHKRAQAKGNKIDCRCFACGNLKELSKPHAPMQERLTSSSQLPQTPITIPHPSTNGEHDHHMPQRLVQWKMTCNNPPTYQRR